MNVLRLSIGVEACIDEMQADEMAMGLSPILACILGKLVEKNDALAPHPTLSKFHSIRAPAISIKVSFNVKYQFGVFFLGLLATYREVRSLQRGVFCVGSGLH